MQLLNLSLSTMAENLALDEALLELAEQDSDPTACLRLWETNQVAVIVGRSSQVQQEVNTELCEIMQIPIYRRCSGGSAIVIGPGCLMYSVVLSYQEYPELRMIDAAHRFVLSKIASNLSTAVHDLSQQGISQQGISQQGISQQGISQQGISQQGISDLTWQNRKFSGNSLRCKQDHFLYHGTILYEFSIDVIDKLLRPPPREPTYRKQRTHADFVTNLPLQREEIMGLLKNAFQANSEKKDWPRQLVQQLTKQRYDNQQWNRKY